MLRVVGTALLFAVASVANAQSSWDEYKSARLDTVIAAHRPIVDADRVEISDTLQHQFWVVAHYDGLIVDATYRGETRQIPPWSRRLLDMWLKSLGKERHAELFKEEALFEEDGTEYWLPVQRPPLSYMREELDPGDEVSLYLTFIGAHAGRSGPASWMFTVNEYELAR
jgi:hypothetical protein